MLIKAILKEENARLYVINVVFSTLAVSR